jgi:hypothetical protein
MSNRFAQRLEKFLSQPKRSEVTAENFEEARWLIQALLDSSFKMPPGHETFPLEFTLVNRQSFQRLNYQPVPYSHNLAPDDTQKDNSQFTRDDFRRRVIGNVLMATDDLRQLDRD